MAVAKQRRSAATIPNHMALPAMGAPYSAWIWNVSHKNAPGAMSAMAFTVRPVRPSVARLEGGPDSTGLLFSDMVRSPGGVCAATGGLFPDNCVNTSDPRATTNL